MTKVQVTYVGGFDKVEIASTGQFCKKNETILVDVEVAGQAPISHLEEAEDGAAVEVHDPGSGLLAQVDNWQPGGGEPPAAGGEKSVDDMTLDELKAHAEANSVDLGDATKKADILAVIKEA